MKEQDKMRKDPWFWQSAEAFDALRLESGGHSEGSNSLCLMEAAAFVEVMQLSALEGVEVVDG